LGGLLGRSGISRKDKNVFWPIPAASVMVHKPLDPCSCEHIWYKGYTNF